MFENQQGLSFEDWADCLANLVQSRGCKGSINVDYYEQAYLDGRDYHDVAQEFAGLISLKVDLNSLIY